MALSKLLTQIRDLVLWIPVVLVHLLLMWSYYVIHSGKMPWVFDSVGE